MRLVKIMTGRSGLRVIFLLFFGFCFLKPLYADGIYFSDEDLHLNMPDQKAVVSWDGQVETMIISSSVRSGGISNIAWVIPLESSVKPEVTESNMEVFKELTRYLAKSFLNYGEEEKNSTWESDAVEVLETKKIDIFDIAVLKADNSSALINWLNGNGYKFSESFEPMFDKYVSKGNLYFVAVKIDLKNRFSREIAEVNDMFDRLAENRKKFSSDKKIYHFIGFITQSNDLEWRLSQLCCTGMHGITVPELIKIVLNTDVSFEKYRPLQKALNNLKSGASVPLEFKFKPSQPYYPLQISSLASSGITVDVYVIDAYPVEDANGILKVGRSKSISQELVDSLANYIRLSKGQYVTRLSYSGSAAGLSSDAVFKKKTSNSNEKYSFEPSSLEKPFRKNKF